MTSIMPRFGSTLESFGEAGAVQSHDSVN